jgi:hypothetical protein
MEQSATAKFDFKVDAYGEVGRGGSSLSLARQATPMLRYYG